MFIHNNPSLFIGVSRASPCSPNASRVHCVSAFGKSGEGWSGFRRAYLGYERASLLLAMVGYACVLWTIVPFPSVIGSCSYGYRICLVTPVLTL